MTPRDDRLGAAQMSNGIATPPSPVMADLGTLWRELQPQWRRLLSVLLCLAVAAATEPALVAVVKYTVDWNSATLPAWVSYPMLPAMVVLLFALRGAAGAATNHVLGGVCADLVRQLQDRHYRQLLDFPHLAAPQVPVARIVHLLTFEIRQCADFVERIVGRLIKSLLTTLALYGSLLALNWRFSLLLTLALPLIGAVCWVFAGPIKRLTAWQIVLNERLSMLISARSRQVALVKIHGTVEQELATFGAAAEDYRRRQLKLFAAINIPGPLTQTVVALMVGVIMMRCSEAIHAGTMTVGSASAYVTSILLILNPLRNLADLTGPILRSFIGTQNVLGLRAPSSCARVEPLHAAVVKGEIRFHQVFAYSDTAAVLADCTFTISPGELVALVGPVGAGKSSVFQALCGNLVLSRGTVSIDGVPREQWSPAALSRQIAIVSQHPRLFNRSILSNVAYADPAPDLVRVWQVLEMVGLGELVRSSGLDTELGAGALRLSEGQTRLLALARALYTKAPLLLLDEPTASLDRHASAVVHAALRRVRQEGRTVLMITHSSATEACADRTLEMSHGHIVKQVTPLAC